MSTDSNHPVHQIRSGPIQQVGGLLIGPAFLVLAAWFILGSSDPNVPASPTPQINPIMIDIAPRRSPLTDPPTVVIAGFEQRCNACHNIFESKWDGSRPLTQHTHIQLAHGLNDQCDNCHARDNREQLVLHDDSTVGYENVAELCAQCHGPVFRDWARGMHGKTLGYWNAEVGQPTRLGCTNCHDPHKPAYDPLAPLPGPHTLRMGDPLNAPHHEAATKRNPLRLWSDTGADSPAHHATEHEHHQSEGHQ